MQSQITEYFRLEVVSVEEERKGYPVFNETVVIDLTPNQTIFPPPPLVCFLQPQYFSMIIKDLKTFHCPHFPLMNIEMSNLLFEFFWE